MARNRFIGHSVVASQTAIIIVGLALLMALPPAQGKMLLLPLNGAAANRSIPLATTLGARLVARGPLPMSMVVYGEQARLLAPMWHAGILILAAPPAGCGAALGADA